MGRRREGNNDSRHYFDWLEFATEDLCAAKILLDSKQCYESCAFHCQQAIEKALKGYLIYRTRRHYDGHNLTWLCRQAIGQDKVFTQWLDESAQLNRYYIETRYPSDSAFEMDMDSVQKVYMTAKEMLDFICREVYGSVPTAQD